MIDGRRARGIKTRARLLDALLDLLREGTDEPTAHLIALRSNVALRTIYHHFGDIGALWEAALERELQQSSRYFRPVENPSVDRRIEQVVRQFRRHHERITPIRCATLRLERTSSNIPDSLQRWRAMRRKHIAHTFAEELDDAPSSSLDILDLVSSWKTWLYLRQDLHKSIRATERAVTATMRAVLNAK